MAEADGPAVRMSGRKRRWAEISQAFQEAQKVRSAKRGRACHFCQELLPSMKCFLDCHFQLLLAPGAASAVEPLWCSLLVGSPLISVVSALDGACVVAMMNTCHQLRGQVFAGTRYLEEECDRRFQRFISKENASQAGSLPPASVNCKKRQVFRRFVTSAVDDLLGWVSSCIHTLKRAGLSLRTPGMAVTCLSCRNTACAKAALRIAVHPICIRVRQVLEDFDWATQLIVDDVHVDVILIREQIERFDNSIRERELIGEDGPPEDSTEYWERAMVEEYHKLARALEDEADVYRQSAQTVARMHRLVCGIGAEAASVQFASTVYLFRQGARFVGVGQVGN
eukprot:TRINITY_DN92338_c0_g1_i1.p1 TRINITY_DN92338_c0_g1~~TRINITY_DN92338_c0_g1_i1.p1  ORF type:complete len:339 (+),score=55.40 TRINITY_DN92338_c0_g1_i1:88-1104(+)